jgi:predicted RNA polymerase sigma factor
MWEAPALASDEGGESGGLPVRVQWTLQRNGSDDTLILLFMCCHPVLSPTSQIALTLRAVGGLSTAEVGRAFLVSEATMTRRITRAKQQIKDSRVPFRLPAPEQRAERLAVVLHVLYLILPRATPPPAAAACIARNSPRRRSG